MSTELIRCPQCGANAASPPDAFGSYACAYCHARFQAKSAAAGRPRSQPAPSRQRFGVVLFFAWLALVIAALAVVAVLVRRNETAADAPARATPKVAMPVLSSGGSLLAPRDPSEPDPSAAFEPHGRKSGYKTSFYVLGMVKNTSPYPIDKPKVVVVLRDKAGKELASRDGYAERDVLAPDESSPVKVLVSDPPEHQELAYEVSARRALYDPGHVDGLKVEQDGEPRQTYGTWEITGKVLHEGSVPARFVKIELLVRNKAGKLIGVESTYIDAEKLLPQQSARFRASLLLDEKPEKIELSVSARPAS